MRKFNKLFLVAGLVLTGASLQAAVPAEVTTAITDVTSVGASVFTAMLAIGIPILAWRLVKRVKGA